MNLWIFGIIGLYLGIGMTIVMCSMYFGWVTRKQDTWFLLFAWVFIAIVMLLALPPLWIIDMAWFLGNRVRVLLGKHPWLTGTADAEVWQ